MGDKGGGKAIIRRCITDEELLKEEVIEEIPDDHRPEDKDLAEKLKVEHEFRTRFSSKLQREFKRKMAGGAQQPGNEIWMHFKTNEEDIVAFVENRRVTEGEAEKEAEEEPGKKHDDVTTERESSRPRAEESWLGRPPSWRAPDK